MEKKYFENPMIKVLSFEHKDIITTSGESGSDPVNPPVPPVTDKAAGLVINEQGGSITVGRGGIGTAF